MPIITANPNVDIEDSPIAVYYFDNASVVMKGINSPEGVVFAGEGSIFVSSNGTMWNKTTPPTLATGWTQMQSSITQSVRLQNSFTNAVGNVGAGLDQLHVITAGAGGLNLQLDGDFIEIYTRGFTAANANTKRYVIQIAGVGDIINTGLQSFNNATWESLCRITRLTSTTIRGTARFFTGVSGSNRFLQSADLTVTDLNVGSIFPQSMGESLGAIDNDIVENLFQVIAYRSATIT